MAVQVQAVEGTYITLDLLTAGATDGAGDRLAAPVELFEVLHIVDEGVGDSYGNSQYEAEKGGSYSLPGSLSFLPLLPALSTDGDGLPSVSTDSLPRLPVAAAAAALARVVGAAGVSWLMDSSRPGKLF